MSRPHAILIAAGLLVAAAAEAAAGGRREKPLVLPPLEATGLVAVRLDADIHAAAADGYGDLRILDAQAAEVPYVVRDVITTDLVIGGFRVVREPEERATRITVDARRQPVTEFTIATDSRNFSRSLTVTRPAEPDGDGPRRPRRPIATATITRIDVAGLRREQLAIGLPESRLETYELVIDDGDSPPLAVTGVTARGPAREVAFLGEPGGAYRLAYGGDLAAPRYDTAAIRTALAARVVATPATFGAESVVATPPPAADPLWLFADGRFQIAVIATLAIILATALFRAAKRIDAAPPSPE
jgi:hypothetical protein